MPLILWAEKGSGLLAPEIDGNFIFLRDEITALQGGVMAESIESITMSPDGITVTGTLGTQWGPLAIPIALHARGTWATATQYVVNDFIQSGVDLYLVLKDHTSGFFDDDVLFKNIARLYVGPNAADVGYDNTTSALISTNVQAAIDELVQRVAALESV